MSPPNQYDTQSILKCKARILFFNSLKDVSRFFFQDVSRFFSNFLNSVSKKFFSNFLNSVSKFCNSVLRGSAPVIRNSWSGWFPSVAVHFHRRPTTNLVVGCGCGNVGPSAARGVCRRLCQSTTVLGTNERNDDMTKPQHQRKERL